MNGKKYVCIDLDGTITHFEEWQGANHFGEPVPGVQAALSQIRSSGWTVIIYTTRANKQLVGGFLKDHGIPFDYINENPDQPANAIGGKPYAEAYIDDRGIQFNGNWPSTVKELSAFLPWEKREDKGPDNDYRREAVSFLGRDYGEAFSQLRLYDTQIWEILKYSFAQIVGSIAAVWVIFAFANAADAVDAVRNLWEPVGAAILIISFLFGLLAIRLILRDRIYFSAAARYINEQRGHFLASRPAGFLNQSGYYDDYRLPRSFSADSTQVLSIYIISLIDALLLGFGIGLLGYFFGLAVGGAIVLAVGVWFVSFAGVVWWAVHYLKSKKDVTANEDLYGKKALPR